ncbi:hypothetical protein OIU74_025334, partial [Salix koriyanagi]
MENELCSLEPLSSLNVSTNFTTASSSIIAPPPPPLLLQVTDQGNVPNLYLLRNEARISLLSRLP